MNPATFATSQQLSSLRGSKIQIRVLGVVPESARHTTLIALDRGRGTKFRSHRLGQQQTDLLSYVDVFWTLAVIGLLMMRVASIIRPIDLGAPPKGH